MADVKINTAAVLDVASKIDGIAQSVSDCLTDTSTIVGEFSSSWITAAGTDARSKYLAFANANFAAFSDSIKQYSSFLCAEVGAGYTETENSNEDLAEMYR